MIQFDASRRKIDVFLNENCSSKDKDWIEIDEAVEKIYNEIATMPK